MLQPSLHGEVKITLKGVIGAATPFRQGGSLRIILPKRLAKIYGLQGWRTQELENLTFVFIETDHGILICPLETLLKNQNETRGEYSRSGYPRDLR